MFLPFHDDNPTRRAPVVTYALVAVNVLAFLWFLQLSPRQRDDATLHRGFIPARVDQLVHPQKLDVWRDVPARRWDGRPVVVRQKIGELPPDRGQIILSLFTCMFLHAGWIHLLGNMWFLWLFGNNVEDRLGHVVFLLFYLAGGLFASGCHWLFNMESLAPVVGASGAVAAVLGAYAISWPWARVHTLVFLVIFITVVDLPALAVLGAWFLLQLVQGHAQLAGVPDAGGVAWWAHVGGFVAGMAMMPLLGKVLGLGPVTTKTQNIAETDNRDRIIDVRILDENDHRRPRR